MINHIKLFKHKGIIDIQLNDLGQTNVVCGKNSSGKSSILECIIKEKSYGLGVQMISTQDLLDRFSILANQYAQPFNSNAINSFQTYLDQYLEKNPIWFYNEVIKMNNEFKAGVSEDLRIKKYSLSFDYKELIESVFNKINIEFKPILIPPKRHFPSVTSINTSENLSSNGEGLVNKLFFLKNHHLQSEKFIIYKKIDDLFFQITNHKFNIIPIEGNQLKLEFNAGGNFVSADDCGLGLKDLLFLLTYILCTDYSLYLIEEPENHLHADFQKNSFLFLIIKQISNL